MNNIVENAQAQIDPSVLLQLLSAIQPPQPIVGGAGGPQRAPNPMASPPAAAPVRPQAPVAGPVTPPNFMEAGGKRFEYPAVRKTTAPVKRTTTTKKKSMTGDEALFEMNAIVEGARLSPEAKMQLRAKGSAKLVKMGVDRDTLMKWIATGSEMNLPKNQPSGYADTEGRQLRMAKKNMWVKEIMKSPELIKSMSKTLQAKMPKGVKATHGVGIKPGDPRLTAAGLRELLEEAFGGDESRESNDGPNSDLRNAINFTEE